MAIVYVAERGTLAITNGSGSTQAVTLSATCGAGNTVILIFGCRDTSVAGCSVADSRGNTWTIDVGPLNQSNDFVMVASTRQDVGTLQSGDTVTVTFGTAPQEARLALLEEFSGLLTSAGYVDKTAHAENVATTSHPTGTTAATTQADELAVAAWCVGRDNSPVHDAGYSDFTTWWQSATGGTDGYAKSLGAQYKILSSTGAQSATATIGANQDGQGLIVTYKAAAAAGIVAPRRSRRTALLRM